MSKNPVSRNRKLGALVAYTTLACTLVSAGVYLYCQQQKNSASRRSSTDSNNTSGARNGSSQDRNSRGSLDNGNRRNNSGQLDDERSSEAQSSSLSRLGSRIAKTVKRNRKVMTISLKNTIVWNPSPDPTTPNYGFVEGAVPLLFHLAENYNLHLILLCPSLTQQHQNGKDRSKLIDPRQVLICETEEGVGHVVRHLESQVHVEALQSVLEMVQGVVPKVVFVQKRPGHSRASSIAKNGQEGVEAGNGQVNDDIMTRSHVRVRSSSRGSNSGSEDHRHKSESSVSPSSSQIMGDSFVEVIKPSLSSSSPTLVSRYVTQAGKKGYVEVTHQLTQSSLNPEYSS
ncbi:hypothetical protein BCR41DRAFT_333587 [Lobosporangium transversale]|uniref:Uncharacterized protein n=1 Tax=Lobosporangium transversale TaxID=64571 RepID=A0A1Y2GV88_9FUNG|nr:hypothetical protein BCR41DRAFT_333587 [Lobosporangium transversale]ORZ24983.1 hypothetical protein BCR41DRAFT_333587 [Lobosporangium transversale]|eukprot:XP_021883964.1 hypothetical protein BCR41DRAFT_333587 [Lobosporangium transversale]